MDLSHSGDDVGRLHRALLLAGDEVTRHEMARAIAEVGSQEAYARLTGEVVKGGAANVACRMALREAGAAALPCVLNALRWNKDCAGLVTVIPEEIDDETAEALVEACRGTTNAWVVRCAVERLARDAAHRLDDVSEVIQLRDSELLSAAMTIGLIASDPGTHLPELKRYLLPSVDVEIQDLALTVPEGYGLPKWQECIEAKLTRGRVGDRLYALQVIEAMGTEAYAASVLNCWLHDGSPSVRCRAWDAMVAVQGGLAEHVSNAVPGVCESLRESVQASVDHVVKEPLSDSDELSHLLRDVAEALECMRGLWAASRLGESDVVAVGVGLMPTLRQAGTMLIGIGGDEKRYEGVYPISEDLLRLQLRIIRVLWQDGGAEARPLAVEMAGLPVAALAEGPQGARTLAVQAGDWQTMLDGLSAWSKQTVMHWIDVNWGSSLAGTRRQWPLTVSSSLRMSGSGLIVQAIALGQKAERLAIDALEETRQREDAAARRFTEEFSTHDLTGTQTMFNDYPVVLLSREKSAIADVFRIAALATIDDRELYVEAIMPVIAEQVLQVALLCIMSGHLTPRCSRVLIDCTRSDNALVAECAEQLLLRLGQKAFSGLVGAVRYCSDDLQRARLLEVCRCIAPERVVSLARQYVYSEHPALCAVCVKTIGQAGKSEDAQLVKERFGQIEELVDVCVLQALVQLDAVSHCDLYAEALSSPCPGTRWAAYNALVAAPTETVRQLCEELRKHGNVFQRTAAEDLLASDTGPQPLPSAFSGEAFPAAGDLVLGTRVACRGTAPWQWGVPVLLHDDGLQLDSYRSLIAEDEQVYKGWHYYTRYDELIPGFVPRLVDLAVSDEADRSVEARALLWDLSKNGLVPAYGAFLDYQGLVRSADEHLMQEAFTKALAACTSEAVRSLIIPNRSGSNPLGETGVPESWNDSLTYGTVLYRHFVKALPAVFGVGRPVGLDDEDAHERLAAVTAQWRKLTQFQDITYGFLVQPNLDVKGLAWYCDQDEAAEDVKREMINYLVASVTVMLEFRDERDAKIGALMNVFRRLIGSTTNRLITASPVASDYDQMMLVVKEAFCEALSDYDAFWPQDRAAYLPLGTLASMSGDRLANGDRPFDVPTRYLPFAHYLERRFEALIRRMRAGWARGKQFDAAYDLHDAEKLLEHEAVARYWPSQSADPEETEEADSIIGGLGVPTATLRSGTIRTVSIEVDGQEVQCFDLATLAEIVGRKPSALRQRERRGQIQFIYHEGDRYYPAEKLHEARWLFTTNQGWCKLLNASRNTVARWKKGIPPGATARESALYLLQKAKAKRERESAGDEG